MNYSDFYCQIVKSHDFTDSSLSDESSRQLPAHLEQSSPLITERSSLGVRRSFNAELENCLNKNSSERKNKRP